MALVRPRPIIDAEDVIYGRHSDRIHSVMPGITGLWQVSGRNTLPYHRRIAINRWYVRHRRSGWICGSSAALSVRSPEGAEPF